MLVPFAPENERDPYPCQSPKTLLGIASLSPDKHPALPHPQLHQTQPCDISPETPYDTAIPLHYGSYEYTRSREHFTPQGAGNKSRRDSMFYTEPDNLGCRNVVRKVRLHGGGTSSCD